MQPIPSVLAILLCEKAIEEADTTKKTLVNIINALFAPEVPVFFQLAFYARMTDCEGEYVFRVDVMRLEDPTLVARLTTPPMLTDNRLGFVELAFNLPPVPFPAYGRYEFQLYGNDVYLAHSTLDVGQPAGA